MFYNNDILARRKSGLGIIWLAATLGDRSVVRRLTRRDILSVKIISACSYIRSPTEPLALRLSSQLMYGVVKLYGHQMDLLHQDVSNAHQDVRRHMLTVDLWGKGTENIDMRVKGKGKGWESITLPVDLAFFTLDFDEELVRGRWSVEPEPRIPGEREVGDGFRTPTPVRFVEAEERITLPRATFGEDEEMGLPRGYGEGDDFGPVFGEGLGMDEDEEVEGLDLGLEAPEAPAFTPGAPEAIHRIRDVGDETIATIGPTVEWPELEDRLAEEAARLDIIDGVPTVTPARRPFEDSEEEVETLLRPPRPRLPAEDRDTELTESALRNSRLYYTERMSTERAARRRRKTRQAASTTAHHLMFGPPEDLSVNPQLAEMWNMIVGAHLVSRRARYRQLAEEARLLPIDEGPPMPPPPSPMDEDSLIEVGVARAATEREIPAALRGARESLPWNLFMEHRRRLSMLPSMTLDQPPSFARETTPLRPPRDVSVETPTGLRRFGESPFFHPTAGASPSTIAPLEEFYFPPSTPEAERFRLGLPAAQERARERSPTPPREVFEAEMEEETRNFYEYARSIRDELEDPAGFLFFSDLAPVASSTPAVAAQAFYHTLTLATGGRMKVRQEEAYGEVQITLIR